MSTKTKIKKSLLLIFAICAASILTADAISGVDSTSTPTRPEIQLIASPTETIDAAKVTSFVSQTNTCTHPEICNSYGTTRSCKTISYKTKENASSPEILHTIEGCVHTGLNYATFNNFILNLNIPGPFVTNEQKFLAGKRLCNGGTCTDNTENYYYNTLPAVTSNGVKVGDAVRFQLYVHNNGKDGNPNDDAHNVDVGVDLSNNMDATYDAMIHPKAFIKSADAQYPEITDDMNVFFEEYGLVLKPKTWGAIVNQTNPAVYPSTTTSSQVKLGDTNVTVSPHFGQSNKVWFTFDKIPGCFQYSNFVYFEAEVKRNICTSLTATFQDTGLTKESGKKLYKFSKTSLKFAETDTTIPAWENVQFKWTSSDPNGHFYASQSATTYTTGTFTTAATDVYYVGNGPVSVKLVKIKNNTEFTPAPVFLNQTGCKADITLPPPPNVCQSLTATHSAADNVLATIGGQLVTVHKVNYTGMTFSSGTIPAGTKLKVESTDSAGKFYTKLGSAYTQIGSNNVYTISNTNAPKDIYYVGSGTVSIHPVKSDGTDDPNLNTTACKKSLTISTDVTYCTALQSNTVQSAYTSVNGNTVYLHTLKKSANFPTYFAGNPAFTTGLKWTTNNVNGKFYKHPSPTVYISDGNSSASTLTATLYYVGNAGDVVTMKLIKTDTYGNEVTPTAQELLQLNQSTCVSTFTIPAEPVGFCSNLDVAHNSADNILTTIGGKLVTVKTLKYNSTAFTEGTHKPESQLGLKWISTDSAGRFYTKSGATYTQAGTTNSYISAPPSTIYYVGGGTVSAHLSWANGTEDATLNTPACNKTLTASQDYTYCTSLFVKVFESKYTSVSGADVYLHTIGVTDNFPTYFLGNLSFPVGIKWTINAGGAGSFYKKLDNSYYLQGQSAVTTITDKIYFKGTGSLTGKLVKINAVVAEAVPTAQEAIQLNQSVCSSVITVPNEPPAPVCDHITVTANDTTTPPGEIFENSWTSLKATAVDTNGNPFGQSFKFFAIPINGALYSTQPADPNNPGPGYATLDPIAPNTNVFLHATKAGTDIVTISTNGTTVPACSMKLSIKAVPPVPTCQSLKVYQVNDNGTETELTPSALLKQGQIYKLKSAGAYSPALTGAKSTFTTTKGKFYTQPGQVGVQTITVNDGAVVYFLPDENATGLGLTVTAATNDPNKQCSVSYNMAEIPAPVCDHITVTANDTTTPPGDIFENSWTSLKATAVDTNGNPFGQSFKFFVIPINGALYSTQPADPNNPGPGYTTLDPIAPNTNVFLHATKAGTDIITISTNGTTVPACSIKLSIKAVPPTPTCQSIKVYQINDDGTETVLTPDTLLKQGQIYKLKSVGIFNPPLVNATFTFTTTQGSFYTLPGQVGAKTITVDDRTVVYFLPDEKATGLGLTVTAATNDPNKQCSVSYNMAEIPVIPVCESLKVYQVNDDGTETVLTPDTLLKQGETYKLASVGSYTPALSGAKSTFTTTQGFLHTDADPKRETTKTVDDRTIVYFVPSVDATGVGLTVTAATNDPNKQCSVSYNMAEIPPPIPVCTSIETTITETDGTPVTGLLSQNKIYTVVSKSNYTNGPATPQVTYTTTKGVFAPSEIYFTSFILSGGITKAEFIALSLYDPEAPVTVADNTPMYFLAFKDQEGPKAFTVQATGFENVLECSKTFDLMDIPEMPVCQKNTVLLLDAVNKTVDELAPGFEFKPGVYELVSTNTYNPALTELSASKFTTTQGGFYTLIPTQLEKEITILDGASVYLMIQESAVTTANDITVKAVSYDPNNVCTSQFNINNPLECISLDVTPTSFDPAKNPTTLFSVTDQSKFGDFKGNIIYSSPDCPSGKFYPVGNDPVAANPLSVSQSDATIGVIYTGGCADKSHSVTIKADEPNTVCTKTFSYTYTPPVKPICGNGIVEEGEKCDGGYNCKPDCTKKHHGGGGGGSYTGPSIDKCIYQYDTGYCKGGSSDTNPTIYIGSPETNKYKKVTYLVTFTPNKSTSATIKEDLFISGNLEGRFDLENIAIFTSENDGHNLTPVCKTKNTTDGFVANVSGKKFYVGKGTLTEGLLNTAPLCTLDDANPTDSVEKTQFYVRGSIQALNFHNISDKIYYIFYQYENKSFINEQSCKQPVVIKKCGEKFTNDASYEDTTPSHSSTGDSKKVIATVLCPYIITRQSGDVFFHQKLDTTDLQSCAKIDNSTGLILRPTKEKGPTTNTGTPGEGETQPVWQSATHDVCKLSGMTKEEQDAFQQKQQQINPEATPLNLPVEYQDALENFSSSVCEMQGDVAKEWKEKYINQAISANITKLTRWASTQNGNVINPIVPANGIVYVKDYDLIIGRDGEFKITGSATTPAAQTYIVENGNLFIESNIDYNDTNSLLVLANPKTIPSAAFIVINGNINIAPDVTNIDGVLMAVNKGGGKGKINSRKINSTKSEYSEDNLTIRGSLIGDVVDLFTHRRASADPTLDQGSIVVRYDERLLLNTPPGLNDLIDISQLRVAN